MAIEARIGTHLWVDGAQLPPLLLEQIALALTIPNPAKPAAEREMLYGAKSMPDFISLYEFDGRTMKIPRGFMRSFVMGMAASGVEISWVDERVAIERANFSLTPIELDSFQELGCQALLDNHDAMVSAPTGGGKTVMLLEAIRRSGQRALVIVEKSSLAGQWLRSIRDMLGYDAGYIGETRWIERDITVALRQSLWANREVIDAREQHEWLQASPVAYRPFWERWGMVSLDEAHHAPADTLVDLLQRFPAFLRNGVSATLNRDPLTFPIAQVVIGPIVHETSFEEAEGRLVRPRIVVYKTDFDFDYVATHKEPVWNGHKMVNKTVRNNYGDMMAALIKDEERNNLIAGVAAREVAALHHCLIVSSRKEHLEILKGKIEEYLVYFDAPASMIFMLFGSESSETAAAIAHNINEAAVGTVLLSTVADEGLDIPRLDRLILAYPSRKTGATKQRVGRVTRRHSLKTDALVIDIMDAKMKLLRDQFRERRQNYYNVEGFEVLMPEEVIA